VTPNFEKKIELKSTNSEIDENCDYSTTQVIIVRPIPSENLGEEIEQQFISLPK